MPILIDKNCTLFILWSHGIRRRPTTVPPKWYYPAAMNIKSCFSAIAILILSFLITTITASAQSEASHTGFEHAYAPPDHPIVLHAARLLDIDSGKIISPGEILVRGDKIAEVGSSVTHPADAQTIDLGNTTLMPGLIDAHVHLFLHPGNEGMQTVDESASERTITAALNARADLMAGFTAERDMGTEGAGSADTAVRNAINRGEIPGPRLRLSGMAISILGGHEDAVGFNPAQRVLGNADYANTIDEIVETIREQHKEGSDFVKMYETGRDVLHDGKFISQYQYTEAQLAAGVEEAARLGTKVGVHCNGEPGALYAVQAGVESIDHATYLSDETMRIMREKDIPAVPTFQVFEYFADHAPSPAAAANEHTMLDFKERQFKRQIAAGIPFAVGSDVGPFMHGTQARELVLMAQYGMKPLAVLQADMLEGAKVLMWQGQIGDLKTGYFADVVAVPGNPLEDISVVQKVSFVMKGGVVYKR
ncbi:MAG TPA: amidohydrolase family protein [Candidatus Acidoferrales bacterium]|nr:amidohydrolase family protein [Candidatus Acidoferrales bacterium]